MDKKLKEANNLRGKKTKKEKSASVLISHIINSSYIDTAVIDHHYDTQRSVASMPQTHLLFSSEQKLCGKKCQQKRENDKNKPTKATILK